MPERSGVMPIWTWIVGAVIVIGIIVTGYLMVQTQLRLETVQSEHESAKEEVVQANARTAELEKVAANLKSELEKTNTERNELQTKLDQATSEIEQLNNNLKSELEKRKAERSELQTKLDRANSEIERLKSELEQAKAVQSPVTAAEIMTPLERAASTPKGQLKSPYADFASVAQEGHRKYMRAGCNGCHGGGGGGGMAAPLTNPVWIYGDDDDTLFRLIVLGTGKLSPGDAFGKLGYRRKGSEATVGPMPDFGEIIKTDDDVWKMIAWMRSVHCSQRAENRC